MDCGGSLDIRAVSSGPYERMARVPLPPWRAARVDRISGGLRIAIAPTRVVLLGLCFASAFLAWTSGGIIAARDLFDPRQFLRRGWVAGWLIFWVGVGGFGFARLFMVILGREVVQLDARGLVLRREFAGIGRTRVFDLGCVRNLHCAPPPLMGYSPPGRGWPPMAMPRLAGTIRFEYGGRTHEFGLGIGYEDMSVVLNALRERVPVASSSR